MYSGASSAVSFKPRNLRPNSASVPICPPRWTWKASCCSPSAPRVTMPLNPMSATWKRAHEFGQPLTLIVIGVSKPGSRRSISLAQRLGAALGLDEGELAELDAGAGDRAAPERRRAHGVAELGHPGHDRLDVLRGATSSTTTPCCAVSRTWPLAPSADAVSASCGQPVQRGAGRASGAGGAADRDACRRTAPRRRCGRGGWATRPGPGRRAARGAGTPAASTSRNFSAPQSAMRNFSRAWLRCAAVAVVAEDRHHAGPDVADLVRADEDAEPFGEARVRRQAAADPQVETGRAVGADDTDEGDVVDLVVGAVPRAAGDRGLELARQVRERRVAEVLVDGLAQGRRPRRAPSRRPRPRAGSRA